jgi:prepilin-type N-terminal cleavage/methylation domain-containing protein
MARRGGFTLAESLMASVVLAIAVASVATGLSASFVQRSNSEADSISVSLARSLMEEIVAKPFAAAPSGSGWANGITNRSLYQNAADFNGYTDSNPFSTLEGESVDVGQEYQRQVTFTCPASITASSSTITSDNFGLVRVTVTSSAGRRVELTRLLTNFTSAR